MTTDSMMTTNVPDYRAPILKGKELKHRKYPEPQYILMNMDDGQGHVETAAQGGAVPPMVTAGFALKVLRSLGERERCAVLVNWARVGCATILISMVEVVPLKWRLITYYILLPYFLGKKQPLTSDLGVPRVPIGYQGFDS